MLYYSQTLYEPIWAFLLLANHICQSNLYMAVERMWSAWGFEMEIL